MTDHEVIQNLHRRMDTQDDLLREIRDKVVAQETMKPALEELVALWKGSKLIIPMLTGSAAALWAVYMWAKDHIK